MVGVLPTRWPTDAPSDQNRAHHRRAGPRASWLAAGGTEGDLMRLAGWKSRSMVDRYVKATAEQRARAAHARLGLGDRI